MNLKTSKLRNKELRNKEFKKITEKKFFQKIIKKTPTIFDIGANNGQSINFFNKTFIKPKIFSFEPSHEQYDFIRKKYNKKNIKIYKLAIHNKNIKKKFYYHTFKTKNVSGLAGFYKINKNSKDHIRLKTSDKKHIIDNINHSYTVDCITLDSFFKKEKIKSVDLLKIDTEGNELNVLKGARKSLKKIKFIKIEVMLFDYYEKSFTISDIDLFLQKYHFKIFNILEVNQNPVNLKTDWIEILYYNKLLI